MSTTADPLRESPVVTERPQPGAPRSYEFPAVAIDHLPNGLTILVADLPGRPLISASVVVRGGAALEPASDGGSTVLAARALTEGTEHYDAIALVEAGERLGASIHADAGWDAMSVSVDVPAARLEPALELVAEVLLHPTFPGPRWNAFATNASTTSSRPRPIRAGAPSRPSRRRSMRRCRRITGHPAARARRSKA